MKEIVSSIHIENGNSSVFKHNDRSIPTTNTIFHDEVNEYNISGSQAIKKFFFLLRPRIEAFTENTGQKLNKNTKTHLSSVVNIKQNTSMVELRQLASHLEDKFDTKVVQMAIHRDEGYILNGENIKNYHAHIEMLGLDSDGYAIKQRLKKSTLSKLQDETAKILNMQRGINYIKRKKIRPKRLNTYEFKEAKKEENKIVETVKKQFTEELNIIRKKLEKATKDKFDLENLLKIFISRLKIKLEGKKPYRYKYVQSLILNKINEIDAKIQYLEEEHVTLKKYLQNAKKMYLDLKQKNSELKVALQNTCEELKSSIIEVSVLENKIEFLEIKMKDQKESNNYTNGQKDEEDADNNFKFNM